MKRLQALQPDWDLPRVRACFFTRHGGVSQPPFDSFNTAAHVGDTEDRVEENRRLLATELPGAPTLQWLRQVHGTTVHRVSAAGGELTGDALVTASPGIACCVLTADCLPVFLASRDGDEVAVAHAGWRGLAAGILAQTVAAMHTPPARLEAWLAPAIGPCHFEVGADVFDAFAARQGEAQTTEALRAAGTPGKYLADLYLLARRQLAAAGVGRVGGGGHCTACDADAFYSYRRDGVTGRNLSLIYLADASCGRS